MSTAHRMHRLAPMAKKNGRGGKGKQKVIDITPLILTEIRDGVRGLSTRMDGIEVRMGGLEGRMDGLDGRMDGLDGRMDGLDGSMERLEARMHGLEHEFGGFRDEMGGFRTNVERRLSALESAVFKKH